MHIVDTPVLIVGAGPAGLFASILLTRQGIANRLIDRRPGPHRAPQAHVVNPRTLEICRAAGLDHSRLAQLATPRQDGSHVFWMTRLAGEEIGRLPYERQGDDALEFTPTPLLNLSQHLLEPVLVERVRDRDGTNLDYRHEWIRSNETEDGIEARVRNLDGDEEYLVRCRYLIAADGAGSRIRRSLGIEMSGPDSLQSFMMIHFEGNLRQLVRERPGILYWNLDPEVAGTFVAHDIDRTWVFMHPYDSEVEAADAFDESVCAGIVRRAIGRDDIRFTIRNIGSWSMSAQTAERYTEGRTFLVGDAAHRFPPSGGMGMNTGIQDAHNLAWKIGAVEHGWAAGSLLQTYEIERLPVAQTNCEQSLINAMKLLELFAELGSSDTAQELAAILADPGQRARLARVIEQQQDHFDMFGLQLGFQYDRGALAADDTPKPEIANIVRDFVPSSRPGSRLPHAWIRRRGVRVSSLDLIAENRPTLLLGPQGADWTPDAETLADIPLHVVMEGRDFEDPEHHWAAVRGIRGGGALLVRPDQHVAWRSPARDQAAGFEVAEVLKAIFQGK